MLTDAEVRSIDILALRRHLQDAGWARVRPGSSVFRSPSGRSVLIPDEATSPEAIIALRAAAQTVAAEEGLPFVTSLLVRLANEEDDLFFFGGEFGDGPPGQMEIRKAPIYYRHIEKYLRVSLAAEAAFSSTDAKLPPRSATYYKKVRVGQVLPGSYLVSIHLPLASYTQEPLGRRTMSRIVRCIAQLEETADAPQSEASTHLLEMGNDGWSAPMCESLGELISDLKPQKLELVTCPNPTWPGRDRLEAQRVELDINVSKTLATLGGVATALRGIREESFEVVTGRVWALEDRDLLESNSGKVVKVNWIRPDLSSITIHLELDGSTYARALEAHRLKRSIEAAGTLKIIGMRYFLVNLKRFTVLS